MNRRDFMRRAALIAGGVLAADQVELIERLTPKRYVVGYDSEWVTVRWGTSPYNRYSVRIRRDCIVTTPRWARIENAKSFRIIMPPPPRVLDFTVSFS